MFKTFFSKVGIYKFGKMLCAAGGGEVGSANVTIIFTKCNCLLKVVSSKFEQH